MGDTSFYQPLTKEDRITVIIYRTGIALSAVIIGIFAVLQAFSSASVAIPQILASILLLSLYVTVGFSVFFIHLYVGKFHRFLKKLYFAALFCLAILFFKGGGNPVTPFFSTPPYSGLLLLPLSLCLGFITAKEAFCFRLFEGYLLAIIMPAYLFFYAIGLSSPRGNLFALFIVAAMILFFTFRKIFQPIHYDIGDKSAYQP